MCSSSLVHPNGKTLEMSKETSLIDEEEDQKSATMRPPRPPIIVHHRASDGVRKANDAVGLPLGWVSRGEGSPDEWTSILPSLQSGEMAYTAFDIYRPLAGGWGNPNSTENRVPVGGEGMACKTNFSVVISYKQSRPNQADSVMDGDFVAQKYSSSVIWCAPIKSKISVLPGMRRAFPFGSRHPTNLLLGTSSSIEAEAIMDGDFVNMRCSVEAQEAKHGLGVKVNEVSFQPHSSSDQHSCHVDFVSAKAQNRSNVIFVPDRKSVV